MTASYTVSNSSEVVAELLESFNGVLQILFIRSWLKSISFEHKWWHVIVFYWKIY